jgi:hypothetical protein
MPLFGYVPWSRQRWTCTQIHTWNERHSIMPWRIHRLYQTWGSRTSCELSTQWTALLYDALQKRTTLYRSINGTFEKIQTFNIVQSSILWYDRFSKRHTCNDLWVTVNNLKWELSNNESFQCNSHGGNSRLLYFKLLSSTFCTSSLLFSTW